MSWHHGDYINLISALGGFGSALFAAYATFQARKSTEISKESLIRSERQSEVSRLMDELVRLAERCNSCIGDDNHVVEKLDTINELATACWYAKLALDKSNISDEDKRILTDFFIRHLRPGINGEFEHGYVVLQYGMSPGDKDLRKIYREIQEFLDIDNPVKIPEPK
ncbi:hypothetical protein [Franconibacter helveticus]|uniref:hypothetical protein n=1 Tax=Franconibacter helveticus TaxID=357240 RepID=UPI000DA23EDE|nr:hypothetical protein [Franconibacter helveticus]